MICRQAAQGAPPGKSLTAIMLSPVGPKIHHPSLYAAPDFWHHWGNRRVTTLHEKRRIETSQMPKHSKYQQGVIKNYYKNRDAIALQKLQEAVTELYLSEGKKRATQWKRIVGHLEKLGVVQARIDHLVKQDKPELVAHLVEQLMAKS